MLGEIVLKEAINENETESTNALAEVQSITQSEFATAGKKDIRPAHKFIIWNFEYSGQTELDYDGKRYTVYRTFKRNDDRIELYTEERSGRR